MTATSLPIEIRLGRFLTPFGKQNTTHRHDLHTVDHSLVVQRFLGEEGLKSTGLYLGHSFAPFGGAGLTPRIGQPGEFVESFDVFGFAQFARARERIVNVSFPRQSAEGKSQTAEFQKTRRGKRANHIAAATDTDDQCMFRVAN